MPVENQQVKDIFLAATEMISTREREEYLSQACRGDPALRRRVEALLRRHQQAGRFLEAPTFNEATLSGPALPVEAPGSRIGPYRLLEKLGEGGMGAVWMAEQQEPVRRKVALKVIRPGLDSKQVVARFEAERQALALMDHPSIARVFDGGTTETGRPYFVMELVEGVALTRYCDEHRLTLRQRLELFVPVCQALQHAHQKGVIHRDVKPSNVLVASCDGKSVVKVIDFGIAKAVGEELTDRTLVTALGTVVGTLEYMSPEQAAVNNQDIDTRSDVYSLGVLLYELLTGTTPLSRMDLKGTPFPELLRLVREEEPPRPSTRLSERTTSLPVIAAGRRTEPARLRQQLRGELDWIAMKALEKDRTRRYDSAGGLARDVERYLNDEPVEVCPPSAAYRLRKFVRRHKEAVLATALVLLTLIAGVVGTAWGLVRALDEGKAKEKARQQAVENEETATAEAERARKAEADTRAYARFLADHILAASRPEGLQRGVGHNVTLADALQKAEPRIAEVFRGRKILQALARHQIGVTWQYLGRVGPAEAQLRQAIALREQELGPDDADTLDSRNSLGLLLAYGGRPREAIDELEDVLARHQRAGRGDGRAGLACLNNLAEAYRISGKHTRALELLEPALPKWDTAFGTEHVEWQTLRNNLAMTYLAGGQHSKAVKLQEGVLEQVLEKARARQSPDHALTIRAMNNLATIYEFDGQFKKVLRLREQVWDKMKAAYGADHPETLVVMSSLARAYRRDGKLKLALPLLEESLRLLREKGLANHPGTFVVMCDLAMAHEADGKPSLAEPLYREAAEGMEKLDFQDEHAWRVVHFLSDFYDRSGHLGEAEAWRRKGLAAVEKWFGPDSVQYAGYLAHLGRTLLRQEKWTDAETVLRDSLAIREKKAPIRWWPFDSRSLLGGALLGQKKYAEAEPLLLQGYEGMKEHADANPPPGKLRLTEAVERLVQLFDATGRHDRAAEYRRELEEVKKQKP